MNINGSRIKHGIIIIRTGVAVRNFIACHEVNWLIIIWNAVWNIFWNTVITVCDDVPSEVQFTFYSIKVWYKDNNFWSRLLTISRSNN